MVILIHKKLLMIDVKISLGQLKIKEVQILLIMIFVIKKLVFYNFRRKNVFDVDLYHFSCLFKLPAYRSVSGILWRINWNTWNQYDSFDVGMV